MWGSPTEIKTHQKVADAFMSSHPNIEVVLWGQPWGDYFTKLKTLWAAGDKDGIPDVLFLSPVVTYAGQGVLEPLDPFIKASGYDTSDYWPSLLQFGKLKGTIYGLPRDIGLVVLYYNKDIFDEAGVDYPTNFWTWDDLKLASSKLSRITSSGRVQRYALAMEGGKYQLFIGQNRGRILDDMVNPTRCTLTEPQAVEAVKFFADLMNNNLAMRPSALSQSGGDAGVCQSRQSAMIIQNASRISAFNTAKMNYDVAAIPIPADGQRSGSAGGAAWTMSKYSDDKEAAWTFLSWLQSTDGGQAIYTASGEILPALRSTAVSDAFLGINAPPANRAAFIIEGNNTKIGRSGYFPNWGPLNGKMISPNLSRIWSGTDSVEPVLQQTCKDVNNFLQSKGPGF
jgi:multiple sugar transport system substrate-binding protein